MITRILAKFSTSTSAVSSGNQCMPTTLHKTMNCVTTQSAIRRLILACYSTQNYELCDEIVCNTKGMHGYYSTQNCELRDDTMCNTKVCMPACYSAQNYELCADIVCNTKVCTHACSSTQNYELCDDTMCTTKICMHACYSTQNYEPRKGILQCTWLV